MGSGLREVGTNASEVRARASKDIFVFSSGSTEPERLTSARVAAEVRVKVATFFPFYLCKFSDLEVISSEAYWECWPT